MVTSTEAVGGCSSSTQLRCWTTPRRVGSRWTTRGRAPSALCCRHIPRCSCWHPRKGRPPLVGLSHLCSSRRTHRRSRVLAKNWSMQVFRDDRTRYKYLQFRGHLGVAAASMHLGSGCFGVCPSQASRWWGGHARAPASPRRSCHRWGWPFVRPAARLWTRRPPRTRRHDTSAVDPPGLCVAKGAHPSAWGEEGVGIRPAWAFRGVHGCVGSPSSAAGVRVRTPPVHAAKCPPGAPTA